MIETPNDAEGGAPDGPSDGREPLDLRGLKCPLPAMLARKALAKLTEGTLLTVFADDPMALVDVPHMSHREAHTLLGVTRAATHAAFLIRVGAIRPGAEAAPAAAGPEAGLPAGRAAPHRDQDA